MKIPKLIRRFAALIGPALLAACSLEVEDLPVNQPPELGEIQIQPETLTPADTLRLSISAGDPDGDALNFTWSAGGLGDWVDAINNDSIVRWVAPANFVGVDSVLFSVLVFDYDAQNPVQATRTLFPEQRFGRLLVSLVDLDGAPAPAESLAVIGVDTLRLAEPAAQFTFEAVPWGEQRVLGFQSEAYYGAGPLFEGYPRLVDVLPDADNALELVVAPRSVGLVPGVVGEGLGDALLEDLQAAVDWCEAQQLDELLLHDGEFFPAAQETPRGSAGLLLDARDLRLRPFPGEGPVWIDVGGVFAEIGIYLAGRSTACSIEGVAITGAGLAGAWLDGSGGAFTDCRFQDDAAACLRFTGGEGDTLALERVEMIGGEYGLFMEGGRLEASACLAAGASWYGLYLKDGAGGGAERLTLAGNTLVGLITEDAAPLTVAGGLFAGNGKGCFTYSGMPPGLSCSLFWDNGVDLSGVPPGADWHEGDPLFCDPEAGDWRVDAASPALGQSCGTIGAWDDCDSEGSLFLEER